LEAEIPHNARVIGADGGTTSTFHAGDGIEHLMTDAAGDSGSGTSTRPRSARFCPSSPPDGQKIINGGIGQRCPCPGSSGGPQLGNQPGMPCSTSRVRPDIAAILATRRRSRPPRSVEALARVIDEYDHSQIQQ
jgi:hypothetical protein